MTTLQILLFRATAVSSIAISILVVYANALASLTIPPPAVLMIAMLAGFLAGTVCVRLLLFWMKTDPTYAD